MITPSEVSGLMGGLQGDEAGTASTWGHDPSRVTLHIIADPYEVCPLLDLYQPIIDLVDPNLQLFRVTERAGSTATFTTTDTHESLQLPAIAIMVFLRGNDPDGVHGGGNRDRIQDARRLFKKPPWRFHHNEKPNQGKINAVPTNSQEFFYISTDLPLWAIRHVHYGNEHVRYVMYVTESTWPDQVQFYTLILGLDPDLLRDDFCLFTVSRQGEYDVQFALKKLGTGANIVTLDSVHIQVKVTDVGQLVPLFPNVCRPISDVKWQTTDHDGNVVVLDVVSSMTATSDSQSIQTHCLYRKRSEFTIDSNQSSISFHSSEVEDFSTKTTGDHISKQSRFPRIQLSLQNTSHSHFPFSQHHSNPSALSDSDDLEIDLPSPPIRVPSRQEEDEESLTLTNTSEESGIQMQQGCEDSSFCEEEPLRPCLNKNSGYRHRHVKLKVRFKEEVEAFEDDSVSRLSSGIESEEASDAEMETRFPYIPPGHLITNDTSKQRPETMAAPLHQTHKDSDSSVHSSKKKGAQKLKKSNCVQRLVDSFNEKNEILHQDSSNKSSIPTAAQVSNHKHLPNQNQTNHSPFQYKECTQTSLSTHEGVAMNDIANHARPPPPPYPGHRQKNPPSYHSVCSKIRNLDIQQDQGPHKTASPSLTHVKSQQSSPRSPNSDNISSPREIHNKIPSVTNTAKKDSVPPAPPVRNDKTKLRSSEIGPAQNNKQLNSLQNGLRIEERTNQDGSKTFWFADKETELSSQGRKADGSNDEDTTLKFTLKFDTCPTSGLSCRQEQIGFYV